MIGAEAIRELLKAIDLAKRARERCAKRSGEPRPN
jgi:hypothetical protein